MSIYGPGTSSDAGAAVLRIPVITIHAEERGGLREGEYECSFGNNANNLYSGYPMLTSGTILRMSVSSVKNTGKATSEAIVNIVLNGIDQEACVIKSAGSRSGFKIFDNPIKVSAGSVIKFITKKGDDVSSSSVVVLLIELDL